MPDQFTETTTIAWGQRLSGALSKLVFGLAFFALSFPLLWWNEGRSVERIKTLDIARRIIVEASAATVDPANDAKLVHMIGPATTPDILDDHLFGVRENALKLKRTVEMYQWKETRSGHTSTSFGGSQTEYATYSYDKVWAEGLIDSSRFKEPNGHQNPSSTPYGSREWTAKIHFGAWRLSKEFVGRIDTYDRYPLTPQTYAAMNGNLKSDFTLNGEEYFYGDPASPQIGALRIRYQIIRPGEISIIGRQDKDLLTPYDIRDDQGIPQPLPATPKPDSFKEFLVAAWNSIDSNVTKSTDTIALLQMGHASADSMLAAAWQRNELVTWLLRAGGLFLMRIGLMAFFNPLSVLADFVPPLGSLVGASIGLVTALAALLLGSVTIAAAWIYYRPLLGGALVLLAAAAAYGILHHVQAVKAKSTAGPVAATP